jgi:hypothetical protein
VDECFTAAEIAVLTRYLSQHHRLKVRTRSVRLPISGVPYAKGLRRPLIGEASDRVLLDCLAGGAGHDLPFAVYRRYRQASLLDTWRDSVTLLPDMAPVPVALGTDQPKRRGVGSARWARSPHLQSTHDQEHR